MRRCASVDSAWQAFSTCVCFSGLTPPNRTSISAGSSPLVSDILCPTLKPCSSPNEPLLRREYPCATWNQRSGNLPLAGHVEVLPQTIFARSSSINWYNRGKQNNARRPLERVRLAYTCKFQSAKSLAHRAGLFSFGAPGRAPSLGGESPLHRSEERRVGKECRSR